MYTFIGLVNSLLISTIYGIFLGIPILAVRMMGGEIGEFRIYRQFRSIERGMLLILAASVVPISMFIIYSRYTLTWYNFIALFFGFAVGRVVIRLAVTALMKRNVVGKFLSSFSWAPVPGGNSKSRESGKDVNMGPESLYIFYIGMHFVTNEQYKFFLDRNSKYRAPANWNGRNYPSGKARHPVVSVSRKDAEFYCRWFSDMTGESYRLPDEYEWEKAARGEDGRDYPWEEQQFDPQKCNCTESRIGDTTPVDKYDRGRSPYECYDMVGNVSEWTSSTENGFAVIRGSSYKTGREQSNCYYRILLNPDDISDFIGFRIVREAD
jgi:hypothetical protein